MTYIQTQLIDAGAMATVRALAGRARLLRKSLIPPPSIEPLARPRKSADFSVRHQLPGQMSRSLLNFSFKKERE